MHRGEQVNGEMVKYDANAYRHVHFFYLSIYIYITIL